MKLGNKINLSTTVLFLCLLMVLNIAIYFTFSHLLLTRELDRVTLEAEKAAAGIRVVTEDTVSAQEVIRAYVPVDGMIRVVNADGTKGATVESSEQPYLYQVPARFSAKEEAEIIDVENGSAAFVSLPVIWLDGKVVALQMTSSLQPLGAILRILRLVLFIGTVLAILPVVFSSRLLSQVITSPISKMTETMREILESGRFKRLSLGKKSSDELFQMGETFNHMMNLLERNYEKQGQFISNASHELKTPLTVIEAYASLLKRRGKQQPEVFDESVTAILSETARMKELTQQLLLLAKHEEQWNVQVEKFDLYPFLLDLIQSFEKAFQRPVILSGDKALVVTTDRQKCKQLLYIFMDNARKYSEESIAIHVWSTDTAIHIEVKDCGIGIPSESLERIFERFYRVDEARSHASGGYGLGLSLARELAETIGARIVVESEVGKGTQITLALPIV